MTLLRYTGQQPTSFMAFPYLGEVEPGEFEARESDAESLLARPDVERADPAAGAVGAAEPEPEPEPAAPVKPRKTSISKPADADPAPADTTPTVTT